MSSLRDNPVCVPHTSSEAAVNLVDLRARVDNDAELLRELVALFKAEYPALMCSVRGAIASADLKSAQRSSHTLKGMFLSLAATRAAASAAQLEELGRTGDTAALPAALAHLEREGALVLPDLESHLAKFEP